MKKTSLKFKNNEVIIFSTIDLGSLKDLIFENLKSENVINFHAFLLNTIDDGWYAELILNNKRYLLNDFRGSFRIYINIKLKIWSLDFWSLLKSEINYSTVDEVLVRGYTTGYKTISNDIHKLLPSSIFEFDSLKHLPNVKGIFSSSIANNKHDLFDYKKIKDKKVGIAFSGGLDSTYLASELVKLGIMPDLYFCISEIDDEKELSLIQATAIAKKLNLKLTTVKIYNNEIIDNFPKYYKKYPNDLSYAIISLKLFIQKIEDKVDVLVTGQNSDTFIAFGLSRAYHPIETLSRFVYNYTYKKIYNGIRLNIFDKLVLFSLYKSRNLDTKSIPKNRNELLYGWSNEKFYLSRYNSEIINNCDIKYYDRLDYYEALILNKIVNHLAGNHSLVWSDSTNVEILMPLGNLNFMQSCFKYFGSWAHVFKPKNVFKKQLIIKFTRKNYSYFKRVRIFLNPSKNFTPIKFNFRSSFKKLLKDKLNKISI